MLEVLVVLVAFGLVALLLGFSRWLAHRPWSAAGNLAVAVLLFILVHRYWPAAIHLQTYETAPVDGPIAQVHCEQVAPRAYRVTLTRLPSGRMQVFELVGDEWRLEARTLAWQGHAARVGLQPLLRLDRLGSRQLQRTAEPGRQAPTSYPLADREDAGEDVWAQARTATRWESQAIAERAYGPWRRLADGARYDVWMTGLRDGAKARIEARPGNAAAATAIGYTPAQQR